MPNLESVRTDGLVCFWFWGGVATALTKYSLAAGKTSGTFYVQCSALLHHGYMIYRALPNMQF